MVVLHMGFELPVSSCFQLLCVPDEAPIGALRALASLLHIPLRILLLPKVGEELFQDILSFDPFKLLHARQRYPRRQTGVHTSAGARHRYFFRKRRQNL